MCSSTENPPKCLLALTHLWLKPFFPVEIDRADKKQSFLKITNHFTKSLFFILKEITFSRGKEEG